VFARDARTLAVVPLAIAAWFANPLVVGHSMNCLESGLYVLVIVIVARVVIPRSSAPEPEPAVDRVRAARWVGIGALLGLAFWARNDALFLCLAVGGTHLIGRLPGRVAPLRARIVEVGLAAATVTLLALPWLLHNWVRFGSIQPISGQAQARHAVLGGNLWLVPIKLFEYLTLLPIPGPLEAHGAVIAATALVVLAVAAGLIAVGRSADADQRATLLVGGLFTLGLGGFYGTFFGADHFMSRYMFSASPFLILVWAALLAAALAALDRVGPTRVWSTATALGLLAVGVFLNARLYRNGAHHAHFQVVGWVEANVAPEEWVGAIQSGTLGFFHDRTLNLDGKVNPHALAARRRCEFLRAIRKS